MSRNRRRSSKCQALVCNGWLGRKQCSKRPVPGSDLCGHHVRWFAKGKGCGRVTGAIPWEALRQFKNKASKISKSKSESVSQQWYARHLMWAYASQEESELQDLSERDAQGDWVLDKVAYERCLQKIHANLENNN